VQRYKFWPKRQDFVPPIERVPLADELQPHVPRETKTLGFTGYVKLIPNIFTIIKGVAMSNWKTTVTGIVGALAVLVNSLTGVALPQDAIIAVTLFALGFFAKDGKSND
jgi:hypothetical protein